MKKLSKILILPVLILCSMFMLCACGAKEDGLALNSAFKTEYYVGEALDVTGGILDFTKNGETTQIVIEKSMVLNFSSETAATRNMVIAYTDPESEKTYTITVKYVVKEIPAYPLDRTGTVKYKTEGYNLGVLFLGNQVQMGDFSDEMVWKDNSVGDTVSIYSKTFNKEKGCWEVLTKAYGGMFFKLIDITENSFTMEAYNMSGAGDIGPTTETNPVLEGAVLAGSCTVIKVPPYPLDKTKTVVYKSTTPDLTSDYGDYVAMMFSDTQIRGNIYSDGMTWETDGATTSNLTIHSREFNKAKGCWEVLSKALNGKFMKLTDITENSFTLETYSMPAGTPESSTETDPILEGATQLDGTYTFIKVIIPEYPLDVTGTVKYKSTETVSQDVYEGIMLSGSAIQLSNYSDDMTWKQTDGSLDDPSSAHVHYTFHTKKFNEEKNCWEIITMARMGVYLKLTDITEDSFTLEGYKMANTDGLTEAEIDPVLEGAVLQSTLHIIKVA